MTTSVAKPLFQSQILGSGATLTYYRYAAAADGKRFLAYGATDEAAAAPITVVENWQAAQGSRR